MKEKLNARIMIIYTLVIILGLVCLLPLWNIVAISLSGPAAVAGNKVGLIPVDLTFGAYEKIMSDGQFWRSFGISVLRVAITLALNLVLIVLMAYPLAKSKRVFRGRTLYMNLMIFAMLFNGGMIPTYLVVKQLGLLNTIWALILPGAVPIFSVILVMNFFRGIPKDIEEAAVVDGANWLTTLVRIYLPLSLPSLATVTLFIVVGHWNEWFDGMIYNNKSYHYPLMTFLQYEIINFKTTDLRPEQLMADPTLAELNGRAIKSAAIILCTLPVLVFYPFLQRFFISGIVVGSVKG